MAHTVYLDHSATTPVDPRVIEIMAEMMNKDYGNPSSLHGMGLTVEKRIRKAREQIAKILNVKSQEIIFTSGGTEANNLAIRGIAHQYRDRGKHLITSEIEHPSVLNLFKRLEKEGYRVTYLKVDREGFVNIEDLKNALIPGTILVSIMFVNNEIGSIQPIKEFGELIKNTDKRILFHVDAVQAFGKFEVKPRELKTDLLTISGHKIHGPKGIGALYINDRLNIESLLVGGGQERDIRSGTENVPGIIGFGLAAELSMKSCQENMVRLQELKLWFIKALRSQIPDVRINGAAIEEYIKKLKSAANIINVSFPGLKAEVLLHALEEFNIYVSTGSACHSKNNAPSHVLKAIGLNQRELESAIRISLSLHTQREELAYLLDQLPELVEELRTLMQR